MATMLLCCWSEWTRRILSSGATRATTPISGSCAASSSSVRAANSAPVRARPVMPSSLPMAAAVTAWSPVIMRTSMPALWHLAMAALASARGGSTMPTIAMMVRSCIWLIRSADGSKPSTSKSRRATTITRWPDWPMRSFSATAAARWSTLMSWISSPGDQ